MHLDDTPSTTKVPLLLGLTFAASLAALSLWVSRPAGERPGAPLSSIAPAPTRAPLPRPTPAQQPYSAQDPWGVKVCTQEHYNADGVYCNQADTHLGMGDILDARVAVSGLMPTDGSLPTFSADEITLGFREQDTGDRALSIHFSHRYDVSIAPHRGFWSGNLGAAYLFSLTWPQAGHSYEVEATERQGSQDVLLGTWYFTLTN
jgi:hypothetical protein